MVAAEQLHWPFRPIGAPAGAWRHEHWSVCECHALNKYSVRLALIGTLLPSTDDQSDGSQATVTVSQRLFRSQAGLLITITLHLIHTRCLHVLLRHHAI